MPFGVRLRNKALDVVSWLMPAAGQIQPSRVRWDRRWREVGQFELIIRADTPLLSYLTTLGNYIEIVNLSDDSTEALYIIERSEFSTGIVKYDQDISNHLNAVYAAGQGTGTLRDLVVRLDADSITEVGRMEFFLDARDVELGSFDLLRQRADAKLDEVEQEGGFVATGGKLAKQEVVKVSGSTPLLFAEKRVILPPPATAAGDIVDITSDEYDEITASADNVMKHYITDHLVAPADGSRAVANFVNQGAIPPLLSLTYRGRFQTVLEALREIGQLATAGYEVVFNASDEFEFQVLPQVDKTFGTSEAVVFRSHDPLPSVAGRLYREDWDIGDLVTLELETLAVSVDVPIRQVRIELRQNQPELYIIAFDTPNVDDIDRLKDAILSRTRQDTWAARV